MPWPGGKLVRPSAKSENSQVWAMKSSAQTMSESTVARPTSFGPPTTSSDKVEIASKPRKLNTASDSAPKIKDGVRTAGL